MTGPKITLKWGQLSSTVSAYSRKGSSISSQTLTLSPQDWDRVVSLMLALETTSTADGRITLQPLELYEPL